MFGEVQGGGERRYVSSLSGTYDEERRGERRVVRWKRCGRRVEVR